MSSKYLIRQVRSNSGQTKRTIATLKSIGLGRIGKEIVLSAEDPCILGKITKLKHLVYVTDAK